MSLRPVRQLLADILERIERIEEFTSGLDQDSFVKDTKTTDAVIRNLEVIGEAASRHQPIFAIVIRMFRGGESSACEIGLCMPTSMWISSLCGPSYVRNCPN